MSIPKASLKDGNAPAKFPKRKYSLHNRPDRAGLGRGFGSGAGLAPQYNPVFARICYKLRLAGLPIDKIADVLEFQTPHIEKWRKTYPEFEEAWQKGGALADANVARSLYGRAVGYKHKAEKIFNNKGVILRAEYIEHYPPDTGAIELWLTNRQPDHWKKRSSQELTGANGSPLYPPPVLVFDFAPETDAAAPLTIDHEGDD
jgi:hypothetical protein